MGKLYCMLFEILCKIFALLHLLFFALTPGYFNLFCSLNNLTIGLFSSFFLLFLFVYRMKKIAKWSLISVSRLPHLNWVLFLGVE